MTARTTDMLAVCWGLFVSVAITTARLQRQRHGASSGCYVIHGRSGRRCGAKSLATKLRGAREEASGGSANTQKVGPQLLLQPPTMHLL